AGGLALDRRSAVPARELHGALQPIPSTLLVPTCRERTSPVHTRAREEQRRADAVVHLARRGEMPVRRLPPLEGRGEHAEEALHGAGDRQKARHDLVAVGQELLVGGGG